MSDLGKNGNTLRQKHHLVRQIWAINFPIPYEVTDIYALILGKFEGML